MAKALTKAALLAQQDWKTSIGPIAATARFSFDESRGLHATVEIVSSHVPFAHAKVTALQDAYTNGEYVTHTQMRRLSPSWPGPVGRWLLTLFSYPIALDGRFRIHIEMKHVA